MVWRPFARYGQRPHHGVPPLREIGRVALRSVAVLVGCLEIVDVMQPRRVGGAVLGGSVVDIEVAKHLGNDVLYVAFADGQRHRTQPAAAVVAPGDVSEDELALLRLPAGASPDRSRELVSGSGLCFFV